MLSGALRFRYGTGAFLLANTGTTCPLSRHGLLSTVAYRIGADAPTTYALEGAIAVAGSGIRWLRDNLGIMSHYSEGPAALAEVSDTGGVYFVPAFGGLFAPHWREDARGSVCVRA